MAPNESTTTETKSEEDAFINSVEEEYDDPDIRAVATEAASDIPGVADRRVLVLMDGLAGDLEREVVELEAQIHGLEPKGEVEGTAPCQTLKFVHQDRE